MPDWDKIFKDHGYFFIDPHEDISKLIRLFQENKVRRILDLGCGTGRHLIYFARNGFDMYGFDSSKNAINLAEKWLQEEGLSANLQEHRMEEIFPYSDNFFDAVVSIQVIHHNLIRNILFTIREVERVLSSSGYIFVTVPVLGPKPDNPDDDWGLMEIEEGTYIPQCGPESGIPHHYFTEDELLKALQNFQKIDLYLDDSDHRCYLGRKK
ncbi:class I SAM-dependent methyltransferase [Candidatus Thorarchaeota archaeon]|nr:MAG: class I SAM-dependent methyltransferase [Candidatus Thorarchaeota archaeon]